MLFTTHKLQGLREGQCRGQAVGQVARGHGGQQRGKDVHSEKTNKNFCFFFIAHRSAVVDGTEGGRGMSVGGRGRGVESSFRSNMHMVHLTTK